MLNSEGQPVGGASVYLDLVGSSGSVLSPVEVTNEEGEFRFSEVKAGLYRIHAGKEEEGYPNTRFDIYTTNIEMTPEVNVIAGRVASNVAITLGTKLGKIKGKVFDGVTRKPLDNAFITLIRLDNANARFSTGLNQPMTKGGFELLAPPVPFSLEISAQGYETKRADALRVKKGEIKQLDFVLQPRR